MVNDENDRTRTKNRSKGRDIRYIDGQKKHRSNEWCVCWRARTHQILTKRTTSPRHHSIGLLLRDTSTSLVCSLIAALARWTRLTTIAGRRSIMPLKTDTSTSLVCSLIGALVRWTQLTTIAGRRSIMPLKTDTSTSLDSSSIAALARWTRSTTSATRPCIGLPPQPHVQTQTTAAHRRPS